MKQLLWILLFGCYGAKAETLTLQQALKVAQTSSPEVQRAESAHDETYWKKIESYSAFLPRITGTINYLPTYKYLITNITMPPFGSLAIPGIVPTTIYGLQAEYNIFDGLASTHRLQGSLLTEKAAEQMLDATSFQTSRQVTLQFYRALASKILKQVADSNLKTLEDHLHDTNLLKKSGLGTNYDVLRVEVQVSEANSEVLNTTDDIETNVGHLAQLMGREGSIDPQGDLPEPPVSLLNELEGKKLDQRSDLLAIQTQVDALDRQKQALAAHWIPKISLIGQYQYYDNLNDRAYDWNSFRDAYEFGLNLTWNLFEGFSSEAKKREMQEQRTQLEKTLLGSKLKAEQEVALWKRKFKYFCSVYKARQSDIGKAKEAVRLAKEGRRVGSRTNTDLLDAETDLFRSQAGAVNAQMGVIEALINLELATGQKLYEFN